MDCRTSCSFSLPSLNPKLFRRCMPISCGLSDPADQNEVKSSMPELKISSEEKSAQEFSHYASRFNLFELLMRVSEWADMQKEQGMYKKRDFYTNEDWVKHRSSLRHVRHLSSSLTSRVIISLIPPVTMSTAISVLVSIYNIMVESSLLPSIFPLLHSSSLPYQLVAPALALLLVFRTDTSYSRYDEARRTWTNVISSSKDLARQSMAWIREPCDMELRKDLLAYIMAFPVALKCYIVHGSDIEEELKGHVDKDDLDFILQSRHRPNCIIQMIFQILNRTHLGESERSLLDESLSNWNQSISVCERLLRTPIPLSYTRLTSRFLVLWHITLPVVLWDDCHWLVIPASIISSASLFCIEEVGVLIEEPFPILPLGKMCAVARENIKEIVDLQARSEKHFEAKRVRVNEYKESNGNVLQQHVALRNRSGARSRRSM